MKKVLAMTLVLFLLLGASGCGKKAAENREEQRKTDKKEEQQKTDKKEEQTEDTNMETAVNLTDGAGSGAVTGLPLDETFAAGYQRFAMELFRQTCKASEQGNRTVSPLSLLAVLAMMENGAAGETLAQMEQLTGLEREELNAYLFTLLTQLRESKEVSVEVADSLWVREELAANLQKEFLGCCGDYFQAGVYKGAFDDATLAQMNQWCREHTDGRIEEILSEIEPDEIMYLLNAVAFQGSWEQEYEDDDISEGSFFRADGSTEEVTMLHSRESVYLESEAFTGFVKYYQGRQYAFVGLLPKAGDTLSEAVEMLTPEAWNELYRNARYGVRVTVAMPEFESSFEISLKEILQQMGMTDAFTANADFSQMFRELPYAVGVGRVLQKTRIQVSRKGTEASAATIGAMVPMSAGPAEECYEVRLDRPFLYAVIDTATGVPIFLGSTAQINE